jgi:arginine-tRNA-protein transferase
MQDRLEIVELSRFQSPIETCQYLPAENASLSVRVIPDLTPHAYHELLSRGWRRFGWSFFRHACPACSKCRSLRIPVDRFQPSRSQRRVWRRNADLRVIVQTPTMTREHLELFAAYHGDMQRRKGWPDRIESTESYEQSFLHGGGGCSREFLYLDGEQLVGVGLADVVPHALSSVYCYYDPRYRSRGLGVFSVLKQLEFARSQGLSHQYLGYWLADNQSLAYKSQYRPHEILVRNPTDQELPVWNEPEFIP